MKIISFVKKYARRCKKDVSKFLLTSFALWALSLLSPYVSGSYIDKLLTANKPTVIWASVAMLVCIWTMEILFTYAKNMSYTRASSKVSFYISKQLLEHIKKAPLKFFFENDCAYLSHRIMADSGTVTQFAILSSVNIIFIMLSAVSSFVFILLLCPLIAAIFCAVLPLYVLIYEKFKKPLYELNYQCRESENSFFARVNRQLSKIKPLKQNVWYDRLTLELDASYDTFYEISVRSARASHWFGNIDSIIRYLTNIGIFILSGYLILNKKMSIGQFMMVNSYSTLLISGLGTILTFGKYYRNALVSYDRIMELYSVKQEQNGNIVIEHIESIQTKNLSFSYDNRSLIKNKNTTMKRGYIYALIGANGSGKSTFVDLLTGLLDDYSGEILYNGVDIKNINLYQLRDKNIAIVEQEPQLLFEKLCDNLYGESSKADEAQIWLQRMGLKEFVESLPDKLEYNLAKNINNLSGGEKQRLMQVRAFIKNADVIVLDEPSSAMDKQSVQRLTEILLELKHSKIIIVVTHDSHLTEICDEKICFG